MHNVEGVHWIIRGQIHWFTFQMKIWTDMRGKKNHFVQILFYFPNRKKLYYLEYFNNYLFKRVLKCIYVDMHKKEEKKRLV